MPASLNVDSQRQPESRPSGRATTRARFALCLVSLFAAVTFVSAALADSFETYANNYTLAAGGWKEGAGFNSRDWNRACRSGNSGQMSTSYYNTSGTEVAWSGVAFTNCPDATVSNEGNGYYRVRCWNEGTVSFPVICQAHNV